MNSTFMSAPTSKASIMLSTAAHFEIFCASIAIPRDKSCEFPNGVNA